MRPRVPPGGDSKSIGEPRLSHSGSGAVFGMSRSRERERGVGAGAGSLSILSSSRIQEIVTRSECAVV